MAKGLSRSCLRRCGAGGRNRTDTLSPEPDFESGASTSSTTPAYRLLCRGAGARNQLRATCVHPQHWLYARHRSRIAQLVEQATVNRSVVGSSPTSGARFFPSSYRCQAQNSPTRLACAFGIIVAKYPQKSLGFFVCAGIAPRDLIVLSRWRGVCAAISLSLGRHLDRENREMTISHQNADCVAFFA